MMAAKPKAKAKTSSKPAKQTTKPKVVAKTKVSKPAPTEPVTTSAEPAIADECPKGGAHEWQEDDRGRACARCFEPAPPVTKLTKAKSTAAKTDAAPQKLSALDAAAQVLAGATEPMTTKQMVEQMAAQGLWTTPAGKTPHATLYSAILREMNAKGNDSRFKKSDKGKFASAR